MDVIAQVWTTIQWQGVLFIRLISLWIILKIFIRLISPFMLYLFTLFFLWQGTDLRGFIWTTLTNITIILGCSIGCWGVVRVWANCSYPCLFVYLFGFALIVANFVLLLVSFSLIPLTSCPKFIENVCIFSLFLLTSLVAKLLAYFS